jgi:serine/threonine-protein kinase RsbW
MGSHSDTDHSLQGALRLSGDLDFRVVDSTRLALQSALAQARDRLVIDLSAVDFIDSSGVSVLTEAARRAERRGLRVRLRGLDPDQERLLHTVGLADRFELEPAVARCAAARSRMGVLAAPDELCSFPGEPASVPLIRNHVGGIAQGFGFAEAGVRDILIAVSEAATNALKHGSPGGLENQIGVRCLAEGSRFIIEIQDQGAGFDPLAVPVPVAEQMREGGMGIFFMRALMDEVSFHCHRSGTIVRLVKCRQ